MQTKELLKLVEEGRPTRPVHTHRAIRRDIQDFVEWIESRGRVSDLKSADCLAAFLAAKLVGGASHHRLRRYATLIGVVYRYAGWPDPSKDDHVRQLLRQAKGRSKRFAPSKHSHNSSSAVEFVIQMWLLNGERTCRNRRDIVALLLLNDANCTLSEINNLQWQNVNLNINSESYINFKRKSETPTIISDRLAHALHELYNFCARDSLFVIHKMRKGYENGGGQLSLCSISRLICDIANKPYSIFHLNIFDSNARIQFLNETKELFGYNRYLQKQLHAIYNL